MKKKYKLGVLGLGEGRSIISAALNSELWELKTICDLNEELCKARCNEFGITNYTTNYEDMLADPEIDVIGIYTPDQLHPLHIKQALKANKHVICTKPLMINLDEANNLLELQKETGKAVFVGQSSRFFEPLMKQREDYEQGKHGELVTLETHYISDARWFLERDWSHQKGFSWMYNFIIHAVDLALWYLPDITEVFGMGSTNQGAVPDTLKFLLKNKDGKFASVSGAYTIPSLRRKDDQSISCTLRGTDGISQGGYPKLDYYTNFPPISDEAKKISFEEKDGYYFRFENKSHHAGEYQNYIEYFANSLNKGEVPKPDLKEGIHTIAVMEALKESLETGKTVKVNEVLEKNHIHLS